MTTPDADLDAIVAAAMDMLIGDALWSRPIADLTSDDIGGAIRAAVLADRERRAAALAERVRALEAALRDLLTGAEQQSQSHVDVAVRVRAALTADRPTADKEG